MKFNEWMDIGEIKRFYQGFAKWLFISQIPYKQFSDIMRKLGITRNDPRWRLIHDLLHGEPPMGYKELLEFIKGVLGL